MNFDPQNKPKGVKRLTRAARNSARALIWLYKNEAAFRQECLLLLIAIPLSLVVTNSIVIRLLLVLSIIVVMMMEVINTAIEVVVDRISLKINPLSGLAKDLGSALVMLSLTLVSVFWGYVILVF